MDTDQGSDRLAPAQSRATPWSLSVKNRGQKGALWLVVEAQAHQRHGLDHAETMRQTPAEDLAVTCRQQKAWPDARRGGPDQRLELGVALAHGMAGEPEPGGIAGEPVLVLHHGRGAVHDGLPEFTMPIMAVDATAQCIAAVEIPLGGLTDRVARNLHGQRW